MIKPDALRLAVDGKIDSLSWLTNHFHMCSGISKPFWILGLRVFWEKLEPTLTDPSQVLKVLSTRKDVSELISTSRGIDWLNRICTTMYYFLRLYCYGGFCLFCNQPIDACGEAWIKMEYPNVYAHAECYGAKK